VERDDPGNGTLPENWQVMQGENPLSLLTDVYSTTGIIGGTTYKV
jgi:hypothetical protein